MAQTLITVTYPMRSPSRSHVSVNAKEFIASNKKAHRSLSRDIVEFRLRHVGDGPAHIDAQKNKEISGVQCCHVRDVITCYTLDDAFNMAIQTINHRLLNSFLQKWHIMQNVIALLISKKRIRDRIFLILNPDSISRKKIRNFKINIIYIYVIFN